MVMQQGEPKTDGALGGLAPKEYRGIISRGIREGWLKPWGIDPKEHQTMTTKMREMAEMGDTQAASVITRMRDQDIKLAEMVDKAERLDAGSATEITQAEHQIADLKAAKRALDET